MTPADDYEASDGGSYLPPPDSHPFTQATTGMPPPEVIGKTLIHDLAIVLAGSLHPSAEIGPAPRLAACRLRDVLGIANGETVKSIEARLRSAFGEDHETSVWTRNDNGQHNFSPYAVCYTGDQLFGLPVEVRDGGGEPHLVTEGPLPFRDKRPVPGDRDDLGDGGDGGPGRVSYRSATERNHQL